MKCDCTGWSDSVKELMDLEFGSEMTICPWCNKELKEEEKEHYDWMGKKIINASVSFTSVGSGTCVIW